LIPIEKIEQIKEANDIVDVIGEYVSLQKSGSNYKALCPFHQEKTPSFMVSPQKQIFHCFGCNVGGNVFSFIQKIENVTFVESVQLLARRAGITIEEIRHDFKPSEKEKILEINMEALKYFREQFMKNEKPQNYVKMRGITEETMEEFKIGYAPKGDGLFLRLKKKNFPEDLILKSWLCNKKGSNYSDIFRERLIFPIFNIYSEPIAFGGRVLDNSLPKYINSAETQLYSKGKNLYNLNNARKSRDGFLILVEGYMDAIRLFSYGIKNVIATLGTALTDEQVKILKRYTSKIVVLYDMDDAGRKSAIRAGEIGFKSGLEMLVAHYEGAKDPDDFIKQKGVEAMNKVIKEAIPFINYKIDFYKLKGDMKNLYYKEKILNEMIDLIASMDNLIVKNDSIKKVSQMLSIDETIVEKYVNGKNKKVSGMEKQPDVSIDLMPRMKLIDMAERAILQSAVISLGTKNEGLILKHVFNTMKLHDVDCMKFNNENYGRILAKIEEYFNKKEENILNRIQMDYIEDEKIINLFSELLSEEDLYKNDVNNVTKIVQIVNDCVEKIENEKINGEVKSLQNQIEKAEKDGDYESVSNLLKEKQRLIKIIKRRGEDVE
jgi:DNA primase